jgi:hypothetical protein
MGRRQILTFLMAVVGLFLFISCKETGMESLQSGYERLDATPPNRWADLAQKRIFFGHKSVGVNIVEGLRSVMAARPSIKLDIRETSAPENLSGPVFAHSPIGTNKDPDSKIARFREIMDSGVGRAADIAFFKFCFIDVDHATDIGALFKSYVALVDQLGSRYPDLKIVTFTVPLLSKPVGIKTRLKRVLGRLPWHEEDNIKRNLLNEMLRARFAGSLFDLAAVESRIDGTKKATFRKDGKDYELLRRAYTDDGGHLNATGRQIVALELLNFLAALED